MEIFADFDAKNDIRSVFPKCGYSVGFLLGAAGAQIVMIVCLMVWYVLPCCECAKKRRTRVFVLVFLCLVSVVYAAGVIGFSSSVFVNEEIEYWNVARVAQDNNTSC